MMGEVLVIVVTWNAMTWLERCLGYYGCGQLFH